MSKPQTIRVRLTLEECDLLSDLLLINRELTMRGMEPGIERDTAVATQASLLAKIVPARVWGPY